MTTKSPVKSPVSLSFTCGTVAVNDIFVAAWGYEQTNVSFYQVIALRGKMTAVLRKIRGEVVSRDSSMSGEMKPVPDAFTGEELTRRIITRFGRIEIRIADYMDAYPGSADESHPFTSYH